MDRWLEDPCKEHLSILGEFGTGKTWFAHHYAYQVMQEYLNAKKRGLKRPRLPLVIQLRDYSKALNSESLFSDFFFRKHEIPIPGYSAFEQLNRMGKLLLIFDGFDEMADKLDRQKMIDNFWELARVVVPGSKAILTCRTEHFPEAKVGRALLNAELKASTANLTGDPPQFEVLELEKFNENQIRAALLKKADEKTVDRVMAHSELLDLASRPVMLDFILEALPDIKSAKRIDLSRIYLYAITKKLDRDIKTDRTFTSMADKIYFMCELAWEMLTLEKMSINYRLFPDRLKNLFGPKIAEEKDLDHWHYDMMGNTLLIRNDDGDYSPAHRSLLEFFVAYRLVAELGFLPEDFTEPAREQSNIDGSCEPDDYTWGSYFCREMNGEDNLIPIPPLKNFCSTDLDSPLTALGRVGEAVLRFVHEIVNVDQTREAFHGMLIGLLDQFKANERDPEHQQEIIRFVQKFRRLSQEWEAENIQDGPIRKIWLEHTRKEIQKAAKPGPSESILCGEGGSGSTEIKMVEISSGGFLMGDDENDPIHWVRITRPFMVSATAVTQAQYHAIMGKNPSKFKGVNSPVEQVSWFDAVRFCNELSLRQRIEPAYEIDNENVRWIPGSLGFRLPTEAEWEYAARAGTTSVFYGGDLENDLDGQGWYKNNSKGKIQETGMKTANGWGVMDMHGNVFEWVWDWYDNYSASMHSDPTEASGSGDGRVLRGGSWVNDAGGCRSAIRFGNGPGMRFIVVGFRLSRSVSLGS